MRFIKKLIPQKLKNIYHLGQAILANFWYGFPSRKIKVIGVTGTNGKTTTCQMIARILEEAGHKVAMISTINFKLGEKEWVNDTKYTTFSSFKLQKFVKQAIEASCQYIIVETSSHSLDQYRVWGIDYNTAVITNITREHLDYHKTMEKYRKAKLLLFKNVKTAIVNLDMESPQEFMRAGDEIIYGYSAQFPISNFSAKGGSASGGQFLPPSRDPAKAVAIKSQFSKSKFQKIVAENIELGANYARYQIQNAKFQLNLPGLFNIENALAATCVGLAYGIGLKTVAEALEKIKSIPGRLEFVPNNKGLNIIIDYAVTPDSLDKLYNLIKNIRSNSPSLASNSRVIAVFGACGERDRGKRPMMGEIVSRYADYIILTNEDPYGEDPQRIIDEVEAGIKDKELGKDCWKIMDRREAIKRALALAGPGDFVIITGKGAEETMAVGNKRIPWNDKKVILEELSSRT